MLCPDGSLETQHATDAQSSSTSLRKRANDLLKQLVSQRLRHDFQIVTDDSINIKGNAVGFSSDMGGSVESNGASGNYSKAARDRRLRSSSASLAERRFTLGKEDAERDSGRDSSSIALRGKRDAGSDMKSPRFLGSAARRDRETGAEGSHEYLLSRGDYFHKLVVTAEAPSVVTVNRHIPNSLPYGKEDAYVYCVWDRQSCHYRQRRDRFKAQDYSPSHGLDWNKLDNVVAARELQYSNAGPGLGSATRALETLMASTKRFVVLHPDSRGFGAGGGRGGSTTSAPSRRCNQPSRSAADAQTHGGGSCPLERHVSGASTGSAGSYSRDDPPHRLTSSEIADSVRRLDADSGDCSVLDATDAGSSRSSPDSATTINSERPHYTRGDSARSLGSSDSCSRPSSPRGTAGVREGDSFGVPADATPADASSDKLFRGRSSGSTTHYEGNVLERLRGFIDSVRELRPMTVHSDNNHEKAPATPQRVDPTGLGPARAFVDRCSYDLHDVEDPPLQRQQELDLDGAEWGWVIYDASFSPGRSSFRFQLCWVDWEGTKVSEFLGRLMSRSRAHGFVLRELPTGIDGAAGNRHPSPYAAEEFDLVFPTSELRALAEARLTLDFGFCYDRLLQWPMREETTGTRWAGTAGDQGGGFAHVDVVAALQRLCVGALLLPHMRGSLWTHGGASTGGGWCAPSIPPSVVCALVGAIASYRSARPDV